MKRTITLILLLVGFCSLQAKEAEYTSEDPATHERVMQVAGELRCSRCQGQSLAESNTAFARYMRQLIKEMIESGKSELEVVDFMADHFGSDYVRSRSLFKLTTFLLWLGPFALLSIGIAVLYLNVLPSRKKIQKKPLSAEAHHRATELLRQGESGESRKWIADGPPVINETIPLAWKLPAPPISARMLTELALIALSVAGTLYFCFYQLAPWIWRQNISFNLDELLPWQRYLFQNESDRDGIELYVLYAMMFINLFLVYVVHRRWESTTGRTTRHVISLVLLAISFAFAYSVGFHPPMSTLAEHSWPYIIVLFLKTLMIIMPIIATLYYLQGHSRKWPLILVAYVLIPVCFIATQPLSWFDASYIFAPALRLLHGAPVSEIYFQYDLFPSLLALAWMKLGLDLELFQIVAQASYYLLFLVLFTFSTKLFRDRQLPGFFLVALVLVRIYAGPYDAVYIFQVTPLRLDMWIIPLLLVYFRGAHDWSLGLFCGLMLFFHTNFGLIYTAAYLQLLLTLHVLDSQALRIRASNALVTTMGTFFKKIPLTFLMIVIGGLTHYLLFQSTGDRGTLKFIQLGIGFTRIAASSLYWYAIALSGLSFILLIKLRDKLPANYAAAGFFLVYLMIGNSLYFFGRSHENNLLNISAILILFTFFLLDMISQFSMRASNNSLVQRRFPTIMSIALIMAITLWYGDSITNKATRQANAISRGEFTLPAKYSKQMLEHLLAEIKATTNNSPKVYFVSNHDFLLEYYGGYAPVGYYNPFSSWISRHEFDQFLQYLVSHGYYLVIENKFIHAVHLSSMSYHNKSIFGYVVIWKG